MRIPSFLEGLEKMASIHASKNEDYASRDNPFSNFDVSEYGLRLFPHPRHGAFVWPIFTKLARLSTLLNSEREPNHESVEDTLIDIANYLLLWRSDIIRIREEREGYENIASPDNIYQMPEPKRDLDESSS